MTSKNVLKWEEAKFGEYGDSLEDIQAEFQSIELVSKGSSQIKTEKVKIGRKLKYICKNSGCDFSARIVLLDAPDSQPTVETSSKGPSYFCLV